MSNREIMRRRKETEINSSSLRYSDNYQTHSAFDNLESMDGGSSLLKNKREILDLGEILPGERILGESRPSDKLLREYFKKKFLAQIFPLSFSVIVGVFEFLSQSQNFGFNTYTFFSSVAGVMVILLLTGIMAPLELKRYQSTIYVITSSRAAKIIKKKIRMSIPIEDIENAVLIMGFNRTAKDYTIFLPPVGYMDLQEVNLNMPMTFENVWRLKKYEKTAIPESENKSSRKNLLEGSKYGHSRNLNKMGKETNKVRKEVGKRSFQFLSPQDAVNLASSYWNYKKSWK